MLTRMFLALLLFSLPQFALADGVEPAWRTAYILFGTPKYTEGFRHFDYVNPAAPKGGMLRNGWPVGFDSLNDFILKGEKAPGLSLIYESLMTGALDEPQTFYPLLATRTRLAPDKSWMEFELNPAARWQDGTPLTPEDVVFSLDALKNKADPSYKVVYAPLISVEITAPGLKGGGRVRFHFLDGSNREQSVLAATMPILPKAYYATHAFDKTTLEPPMGSGAYKICGVAPGRQMRYCRLKDYWGATLPVNVGQGNFDTILYDVFRDETVAMEAFKSGAVDIREEFIARNWSSAYEGPAKAAGRFKMEVIPNKIPQGMQGFFFNLRRPQFADRRVREAIALSLDFEWLNQALFHGVYARNRSFFTNTTFEATGEPDAAQQALLEPYRADLPPEVFGPAFTPPTSDGSGNNRPNLLRAQTLLNEAGWKLKDGQRRSPVDGSPLTLEFLVNQPTLERVVAPMRAALKKLGIEARIRMVDSAQYQRRVDSRDFDLISLWILRGIYFPGQEQAAYWHSSQAEVAGSNNISGLKSPAADDLVARIAHAQTLEELAPAARALDRLLMAERLCVPNWRGRGWRLAWWDKFGRPEITPSYGLNTNAWWSKEAK